MRRTIILLVFLLSLFGVGATVSIAMESHPSSDALDVNHVKMTMSHTISGRACCTDGGTTCIQLQCGMDLISSKMMLANYVDVKAQTYRLLPFEFAFGGDFAPMLDPPRI